MKERRNKEAAGRAAFGRGCLRARLVARAAQGIDPPPFLMRVGLRMEEASITALRARDAALLCKMGRFMGDAVESCVDFV